MNIAIERNKQNEAVPYIAHIDTSAQTIHKPSVFKTPVLTEYKGTNKKHYADICGFRVKATKVEELGPQIATLLDGLINMARLPRHVFIARRAQQVYPVYTVGNEVLVPTPGGPIFQHVELAKVREFLTDYLHQTNVLGEKGVSDKLHVRDTNMHTLALRRPVMYLKKRIPGENDFWAPVFENGAGDGIYTYAANARRDVMLGVSGTESLVLTKIVAEALRTDRRLNDIYDLRPDRLAPTYWNRLKEASDAAGVVKLAGREIELYINDKTWIGVESRPDEERYGLYLDVSKDGVVERIEKDFQRRDIK